MPAELDTNWPPQILRIPRSDDPESYVLLRVTKLRPASLDLDIAATEGENPYTGSIRQARLKNSRAKNYQGSDDEWVQIVSYIFEQPSPPHNLDRISGVEVSASIPDTENDEDKEMVLTIRKRIQTITQRLGSISLKQDDEQAIELFDWAGAAVARANALEKHFLSLSDRHRVAEDTIQQLTRQLEELTRAKSDHENQLIANFAQLLNEKKLKVRNQQRLLTSAKVDTAKVSEIQAATSTRGRSSIQKSRRPKRDAREMSKDNSESEIEFEEMQVDSVGRREREEDQETDEEERSTPQPLEEEGDNGTTTDEESVSWLAEQEKKDDGAQSPNMSNRPMLKEPAAPPPRRELPFAKRASEKKEVQNQTYQTEDDNIESTAGETDDDEL